MQRDLIDELIVYLLVLSEFAKDIHYSAHGAAFYSKHLFADLFNFDKARDLIKEGILLGNGFKPLHSKEYLRRAAEKQAEPKDNYDRYNFNILLNLVNSTLELINQLTNLSRADENVIGGIAQDLLIFKGLLRLQIEE